MSSTWDVQRGDCRDVMRSLPADSVDAIVSDPPYGLEFMGKEWDAPWKQRGNNPAGAKFTAGGYAEGNGYANRKTPTYGKGWSNKRCVKCNHIASGGSPCQCPNPEWVIERQHPAIPMRGFQEWATEWAIEALRVAKPGAHLVAFGGTRTFHRLAVAIEDAGWEVRDCLSWLYGSGFPKSHNGPWGGTALKPAWEPIVLARKPLVGTVAANVTQYGTGGINVDGCRIPSDDGFEKAWDKPVVTNISKGSQSFGTGKSATFGTHKVDISANKPMGGRWPANVCLDEDAAAMFPESRFFYTAKASRREREAGCESNGHPTVKPIALMRWLCRLVTPPGGLVLDPFNGSGSTGCAAVLEGFRYLGAELDAEYVEISRKRIAHWAAQTPDPELAL